MACSAMFIKLEELCDMVNEIEKSSKEPSQLIANIGEARYLIGDLRKRKGTYRIEITDRKAAGANGKKIEGKYDSFEALEKRVQATNIKSFMRNKTKKSEDVPIYLVGSPEYRYLISIPQRGLGGERYRTIGKITFPLLDKDEKASIEII
jgi:hypothetical protein